MDPKWYKLPYQKLNKLFEREDTRFMVMVGVKVTSISFGITLFVYYFLFQVMRLNLAFFNAHGFPQFNDESMFYYYITQEALDNLLILFIFHIVLFFLGVYVGKVILRPFKSIGDYSEAVIQNPHIVYKIDDFSTYKLLTRFSEFFFEYLREGKKKGEVGVNSIPPQFSRIHKPVSDKIFMLHFGMLLIIISIASAVFIIENTSAIYLNMVELATNTLSNYKAIDRFYSEQRFILNEIVYLTIILIVIFYVLLGYHLYAKVSGAAFGIFSTMRAFMKGNHSSRVHLVGYAHVREHTRKLNKYLDYIQNNFSKDRSKG